jgi:hypothetical protein
MASNPAHRAARYFKWIMERYGLSERDYDAMLTRQNGLCAICKDWMVEPNVDHCHTTGKVRGLLCSSCNIGLGNFKDSQRLLAQAIVYLDGMVPIDRGWQAP